MTLEEVLKRADDRLRINVDPLKESYAEIDAEITALETKLSKARAVREEVRKAIRRTDPDFGDDLRKSNGRSNGKVRGSIGTGQRNFSPERLGTLTEWLRENAEWLNEGDGFMATKIAREHKVPGIASSQSTFSKMLLVLHDQGVVRLNRVGAAEDTNKGRAKYYKVVV